MFQAPFEPRRTSCFEFFSVVQTGISKVTKPQRRQEEEEAMDATPQAEDVGLSAERYMAPASCRSNINNSST